MKARTTIALITFGVLAALVATSIATNSTWGQRGRYDRLLYRTQVVKKSDLWRVISVDVEFPGKVNIANTFLPLLYFFFFMVFT